MGGTRMELVYYTTHCRMGAWLVGVVLGYALHGMRGKSVKISKVKLHITPASAQLDGFSI